jgi:hypothetical protein
MEKLAKADMTTTLPMTQSSGSCRAVILATLVATHAFCVAFDVSASSTRVSAWSSSAVSPPRRAVSEQAGRLPVHLRHGNGQHEIGGSKLETAAAPISRATFLSGLVRAGGSAVLTGTLLAGARLPAHAMEGKLNLTNEQLGDIVLRDLVDHQFLVTGALTPSIYAPTAKFTDEIDTYSMEQWQKGTAKLFAGNKSSVRLEPNTFSVTDSEVTFRFDEDLAFNVPFVYPVVHLTGKVVLTRDPESGYISQYREFWDQDVSTVLKSVKFF